MMHLDSISTRSDVLSVEPALVFDVKFSLQRGKDVPIGYSLAVRTEDKRLLGVATPTATPLPSGTESLPVDAAGANDNRVTWAVQAVLPLTPRLLDHLDDIRAKNRKQDVVLHCEIGADWLTSKCVVTPLVPDPQRAITYAAEKASATFHSQYSDLWVLSGDGGRTFMERGRSVSGQVVTIRGSDWVHDYLAGWKQTRFVVVELPEAEILANPLNVAERVNAAIASIKKAAANVERGEWNDVLEDLRPVWELLRNDADIQGMLKRDGYTDEAVSAFNESVKQQFALASKFVHRTDPTGRKVSPEIRANKEDAMMCYSFALSLVNLISRKTHRLT